MWYVGNPALQRFYVKKIANEELIERINSSIVKTSLKEILKNEKKHHMEEKLEAADQLFMPKV
jgi:hypothetical protein